MTNIMQAYYFDSGALAAIPQGAGEFVAGKWENAILWLYAIQPANVILKILCHERRQGDGPDAVICFWCGYNVLTSHAVICFRDRYGSRLEIHII